VAKLHAAAQRRPVLPEFSWHDDPATFDGSSLRIRKPAAAPPAPAKKVVLVESDPRTYDEKRRRIRDRYIGIRFAGIIRSAEDLSNAPRMIRAARAAFEEDHAESALELLELAIEQNLGEKQLWLADLEIAFLVRNAHRFLASARAFRVQFPGAAEWNEVSRLGRALAPDEALFGARQGARKHEHYGPWPDLPNWILAPWDLTQEVSAADFHRAMTSAKAADA
jgi:hypothetical protein